MLAKCGTINIWHWAHEAIENCDDWYEPETQWHRDWKEHFGEECSEMSPERKLNLIGIGRAVPGKIQYDPCLLI
ncbi:MAG: hypothetical protein JNK50_01090 [Bacteroidia bacterium]|nr:hypothetical protein [Bacteroidia bacterium]